MTTQILNRRSDLIFDRPIPTQLGVAEIAVNTNPAEPGLFVPDSTPSPGTGLIKIGPTAIGTTAPNSTPSGYGFLSKGESWLDTSSTHILKLYDGTSWQSVKAVVSISAGKAPTPANGQMHYDKTDTKLYTYEQSTSTWLTDVSVGTRLLFEANYR
jgi:hypothetical protein